MSGTELMRIADLHAMEVQVEVSENDIVNVKTGDEADIEVDAYQNKNLKEMSQKLQIAQQISVR